MGLVGRLNEKFLMKITVSPKILNAKFVRTLSRRVTMSREALYTLHLH